MTHRKTPSLTLPQGRVKMSGACGAFQIEETFWGSISLPPPGGRRGGGLNTPPRGFGYSGGSDENERKTRESPVISQPKTPTPTLPQGIGANPNRWRFK